ncbi:ABC transporter ATP-binding protein [Acidisoma cellulosilytica]|uniref:ABC transporter ATP-binding protein n=1 Tax=Acidisoma cellulosilyticum TaxID=2802395 RepID=A0A964E4W8_9PROT|nr:ABC transporter ATP-binding protein [Acidisoma cellulosilyticum]MCB8881926.1 ABC transporter ATP-binding protein [Acidisoma cellulosilyticum]
MTVAPALLTLEDVDVVYGAAITAVRGVRLHVGQGEIVTLLGANGAGKTSTLRAVSNLLHAKLGRMSRGRITFDGRSTAGLPTSRLVSSGLVQVLEGRHCFRALTIEENLITGAIGRRASKAETATDLELVYALFPRLRTKRAVLAGLTSGGEQQMAAIGRALMARPRLLILDEPSMGLAPIVVAEIFLALTALNRDQGLSILLAEQNATVALKAAHRGVVLENGRVTLTGIASELSARDDIRAAYLGLNKPPSSESSRSKSIEVVA